MSEDILSRSESSKIFCFDDFVIDEQNFELRYLDKVLPIQRKLLVLLIYFIKNPEQLLSLEELLSSVWPGQMAAEDAVRTAVRRLRKLLKISGSTTYIKNMFGKGYEFTCPVRVLDPGESHGSGFVQGTTWNETVESALTVSHEAMPFVGRCDVMEWMCGALDSASAGAGRLCALIGEPGIGKTRAAETLESEANARDIPVFWGRSSGLNGRSHCKSLGPISARC